MKEKRNDLFVKMESILQVLFQIQMKLISTLSKEKFIKEINKAIPENVLVTSFGTVTQNIREKIQKFYQERVEESMVSHFSSWASTIKVEEDDLFHYIDERLRNEREKQLDLIS